MQILRYALIALASVTAPTAALAAGEHHAGHVAVGANWAAGSMNNRYNTSPSTFKTFISVSGYANSTLTFIARDGSGKTYSCYVSPHDLIYDDAVAIRNSLSNGSYVYFTNGSGSGNKCTHLYLMNGSHYLD